MASSDGVAAVGREPCLREIEFEAFEPAIASAGVL